MLKLALALFLSFTSCFYFGQWLHRQIVVETYCRNGVSYESVPPVKELHPFVSGDGASCTLPWNLCQKTA